MKSFCLASRVSAIAVLLGLASPLVTTVSAQGWADVTGQFILDGEAPKLEVKKNDKEPTCMAEIPNDELHVNKENKGIRNVFIYIPATKKPKVHPDLVKPKEIELVLDQKNCRFTPHALLARPGQTLLIKSMDDFNHNTRISPTKGVAINTTVTPKNREGIPYKPTLAETLPTQVKCDIHPWMTAWCLMLDHPYADITDENGKFEIKMVPEGDHEFRVWHEYAGGFYIDKAYKVSVKSGTATDLKVIKGPVAKLEAAAAANK